jgi:ABC-type branched-subunit amino acid transport system ATPase component
MPILVRQIADILRQINQRDGTAMVIAEQNVPMVFALTDTCVILEKGRVVAAGAREEISQSEVMRQYLAI